MDIIHPDLASSGGLLETKRIGDYAEEFGIAMATHQASTPVSFMANVHCAAATQNFLSLEHYSVDIPWWEDMVKMTDGGDMIAEGYANVPLMAPGLGIELNEEVIKEHLYPRDKSFFAPTTEWNQGVPMTVLIAKYAYLKKRRRSQLHFKFHLEKFYITYSLHSRYFLYITGFTLLNFMSDF